jgi:hypothetical protein
MTTSPPPNEGMLVGIPIGGGCFDCCYHLVPGLKTPAFERQRTQDLPPGFDQVQIGRIRRLIDKLPAGMMDHEQQQVTAVMHLQIVHDGRDALFIFWDLRVHIAEKVHKVHGAAAWVALRPTISCGLPQRPIDIAKGSASLINLLFGSLGRTSVHLYRLLPRIALG